MAASLQLDVDRFASELENARYRDRVNEQADEARRLGASGTPTFFINGEKIKGESSIEEFQKRINPLLKS